MLFDLYSDLFHFFKATLADLLILVGYDIVCLTAENAGGSIFVKDNSVLVGKHFNAVAGVDVKHSSDLYGENDASKLVDLSYHSK